LCKNKKPRVGLFKNQIVRSLEVATGIVTHSIPLVYGSILQHDVVYPAPGFMSIPEMIDLMLVQEEQRAVDFLSDMRS